MNLRLVRFAIVAVMAAAACSSDNESTTAPTQQLDVSAALATTMAGDAWNYPFLGTIPTDLSLKSALPTSCAFSQTSHRFDCAPVSAFGLTFTTSYYLLGADGTSLPSPTAAAIASIRELTDVTGTLTLPNTQGGAYTFAVNKHQDMSISGLLANSPVLNGSSTDHDVATITVAGVTTTSTINVNSTTVDLVPPSTTNKYPASGTITADVALQTALPLAPPAATHATLTFNGTNIATLVTTTGSHTQTCRIDLSFASSPACS